MRRGGVREHSVRSCRLRWLGRMRRGGVREVAAHTSQAKPLFVRNRRCVILWRTCQFLVFLTFHYTDRSAEPHFSSLIIGVWVQVRAGYVALTRRLLTRLRSIKLRLH